MLFSIFQVFYNGPVFIWKRLHRIKFTCMKICPVKGQPYALFQFGLVRNFLKVGSHVQRNKQALYWESYKKPPYAGRLVGLDKI